MMTVVFAFAMVSETFSMLPMEIVSTWIRVKQCRRRIQIDVVFIVE